MERVARGTFDLRVVNAIPRIAPIPIKVIWPTGRDRDPALGFLRTQLAMAAKAAIQRA